MLRKTIICLASVSLLLGGISAFPERSHAASRHRLIILFGASWCAPCRAELRKLPLLAARARPDQVVIAWLDHIPGLKGTKRQGNVTILSTSAAHRLFHRIAPGATEIPLTKIVSSRGVVCATVHGPLKETLLRIAEARCANRGGRVSAGMSAS